MALRIQSPGGRSPGRKKTDGDTGDTAPVLVVAEDGRYQARLSPAPGAPHVSQAAAEDERLAGALCSVTEGYSVGSWFWHSALCLQERGKTQCPCRMPLAGLGSSWRGGLGAWGSWLGTGRCTQTQMLVTGHRDEREDQAGRAPGAAWPPDLGNATAQTGTEA